MQWELPYFWGLKINEKQGWVNDKLQVRIENKPRTSNSSDLYVSTAQFVDEVGDIIISIFAIAGITATLCQKTELLKIP